MSSRKHYCGGQVRACKILSDIYKDQGRQMFLFCFDLFLFCFVFGDRSGRNDKDIISNDQNVKGTN